MKMGKKDSIKRIMVLQLATFEFLLDVGGYAFIWFFFYKKMVEVRFWQKGDALVLMLYAVILGGFLVVYGGGKIGYLRSFEIFLSHTFSILASNIFAYGIICLMNGTAINPKYIIVLTLIQLLFALGWSYISNYIYRSVFAPRELLLICGERPVDEILEKFKTRKDRFEIVKVMNISEGEEAIMKEIPNRYQGVVVWDIPQGYRNNILKFCYSRSIRVYMMPKISDVIVQGADVLHFFDTPMLLTREYPLNFEQRVIKRVIDLFCSIVLIILTSPIMLITAILIKISDGGPVLYKQERVTLNNKRFKSGTFSIM